MKLGLNSISVWFSLLMILLVISGAIAFTFTDFMDDRLYGNKRIFFVCLLSLYAVYRVFRLYQLNKSNQNQD